ncbi:hydrolase [Campylobacterota bacterium]|nr:hydrolase [Campylobacterota bacterium]
MPKNRIVLFDLDGTLIDSTEAIVESFYVAFDRHKLQKPPIAAITALIGNPLSVMFELLGVPPAQIAEVIASYKAHYRVICFDKTALIDTASEAIAFIAAHARLGVVTTKTSEYSRELLAHLGIADAFATIVGFDDVRRPKPDAEPLLLALKNLKFTDETLFMVGDTPIDMQAALNASAALGHTVTPVAVQGGYAAKEALLPFTDRVFDTVLEACQNITTV